MNRAAIVAGSGPSLDKIAPKLKDWSGPIFSPTTSALNLVKNGKEPTYYCAFDSLHSTANHMSSYNWKNTTLLTHPNAEPKLMKKWKWEKKYYRRIFPEMEYFELILPMMYPMIRIGVKFTGSVVNNCISLCEFLGYNPIILIGVDLGWRNDNIPRATYYEYKNGVFIEDSPKPIEINGPEKKQMVTAKNGIRTYPNLISFKNEMISMWANTDIQIINCSDSLITEFSEVDVDMVIGKQGFGLSKFFISKEQKKEIAKEYFRKLHDKELFEDDVDIERKIEEDKFL